MFSNKKLKLNSCQTFKNIYHFVESTIQFKFETLEQKSFLVPTYNPRLKDFKNFIFVLFLLNQKEILDPYFLIITNDEEEKNEWLEYYKNLISDVDPSIEFHTQFINIVTKDELHQDFPTKAFFDGKSPWVTSCRRDITDLSWRVYSYRNQSPVGQVSLEPIAPVGVQCKYYNIKWDAVVLTSPKKILSDWKYLYTVNALATHYKLIIHDTPNFSQSSQIDYFFMLYFLAMENKFDGDGDPSSNNWCTLLKRVPEPLRELKIKNLYTTFQLSSDDEPICIYGEEKAKKRGRPKIRPEEKKQKIYTNPILSSSSSTSHHISSVIKLKTITLPHSDFIERAFNITARGGFPSDFYKQEHVYLTKALDAQVHILPYINDPYTFVLYSHGSLRDICIALGNFPYSRLLCDLDTTFEIQRLFILDPLLERPDEFIQELVRKVSHEIIILAHHAIKEDFLYNQIFPVIHARIMRFPGVPLALYRSSNESFTAPLVTVDKPAIPVSDFMSEDHSYRFHLLRENTQNTALTHHKPITQIDSTTPLYGFNDSPHRHFTIYDTFFEVVKYMDKNYSNLLRDIGKRVIQEQQRYNNQKAYYDAFNARMSSIFNPGFLWDESVGEMISVGSVELDDPTDMVVAKSIHTTLTQTFEKDMDVTFTRFTPTCDQQCFVSQTPMMAGDSRVIYHVISNSVGATPAATLKLNMALLVVTVALDICTTDTLISSDLTFEHLDKGDSIKNTLSLMFHLMHPSYKKIMGTIEEQTHTLLCCDKVKLKGILGVVDYRKSLPFADISAWMSACMDKETQISTLHVFPRTLLDPLLEYYTQRKVIVEHQPCEVVHIVSHTTSLFVTITFLNIKNCITEINVQ